MSSSIPALFANESGTELFDYQGNMNRDDFDNLLAWATGFKASDITFQPGQPVWAEIAGKWRRITRRAMSVPEVDGLLRFIYDNNATVEINMGHALDPAYEIRDPREGARGRLRFRVNITGGRGPHGATGAAQITIRSLPSAPLPLAGLSVPPDIQKYFRPNEGLNLICGPTGSGKSTLLSSLIDWRCSQEDANEKVIEFSAPIEFVYDHARYPSSFIFQSEVGVHLKPKEGGYGSQWAEAVKNAMRRKPSIIVIGESRDKETIEACVQGAMTGHLVLSTLHTIGVPETLRRLVVAFPGNERQAMAVDILQVVNLVVTQLLRPKLGGGKVAIREYMVFDASVRRRLEGVAAEEWPGHIRRMLEEKSVIGQSMADNARELFEQGLISDEERKFVSTRTMAES